MDRNNAVGLIIILFILLGWSYWMSNQNLKRAAAQKKIQDSIALTIPTETPTQDSTPPTVAADPDSIRRAQDHALYGNLADYMHGTEEVVTLENNLIKIDFNTKGGFISKAELKEYQREFEDQEHKRQSGPLYLLDNPQNKFGYTIPWGNTANGKIVTSDFFFSYNREGNALVFRLPFGEGSYFEQRYTLQPDSYILDYSVKLVGLPGSTGTQQVQLNWENYLDKIEINDSFERFYSTNYYKEVDEDPNYCSCRSNDTKTFENKPLKWISNSNQFFNTSIIAETSFPDAVLSTEMLDKEAAALKKLTTQLSVPLQGTDAFQMKMYVGPNEFKRLRAMGYQMEDIIPFGRSVFGTINRWVFRPLFGWLLKYIGSAGIVILILTLLVKAALFPLTYQSLHSQIKMSALKPYIASLKDKFKDDQQQQQMETMKLYREFGVNPLGGCLPMVLQMPVWFALYRFFPASIEFRQESFLWAHDLSSYDVFFRLPFELPVVGAHISLFTILWAGSTLAYTYYNSKMMDMSNVNPAMKYVQYLMPLMFTVYFNNYASGLTCYLLFSNLLNIGQTLGAKRFLFDESKILEKLEANKKKPKKKSGFQARLEEALKEQQRQAAQKQSPKKK
ncbi:MAG TPA: membrane protein insertase YidC [Saprospiraceae bacterium]|nr:membrane protein insertase YidC [Saprospiraceae bacterium]MCB9268788.1 membrane protein insertase YidC [Lewinellaceae bacterium]HPG05624.1 membrane protein insertase YidC [Saprospiraceae bacterium]HRV83343.1 membrane protein insertase YidC [Saprospiraceae bacterium]